MQLNLFTMLTADYCDSWFNLLEILVVFSMLFPCEYIYSNQYYWVCSEHHCIFFAVCICVNRIQAFNCLILYWTVLKTKLLMFC